jgi:hypothetical protein
MNEKETKNSRAPRGALWQEGFGDRLLLHEILKYKTRIWGTQKSIKQGGVNVGNFKKLNLLHNMQVNICLIKSKLGGSAEVC